MTSTHRIGWICNSAIITSETFLTSTLEVLSEIGEVDAYCGRKAHGNPLPDITYCTFAESNYGLIHSVIKRLFGINHNLRRQQKSCSKQLHQKLASFKPTCLWIEYGTTAHVAEELIRKLKVPYFISVHGFDVSREFRDPDYKSAFVRLANSSKAVICASQYVANKIISIGVREDKVKIIRLHVKKSNSTLKPKTKEFITVGRLVDVKGTQILLHAFRTVLQHTTAHLTIVGNGPLFATLQQQVHNSELSNHVTFTGELPHNDTLQVISEHEIYCQTNVTGQHGEQEAFGLTIAEAALQGLPVIATNHGGIPEQVEHGNTGYLTQEYDFTAIAKAMIELINDKDKAIEMGSAGKAKIERMCGRDKRKKEILTLLI